jgi:hypothetical protein
MDNWEDIELENRLWPWLADGSMECQEDYEPDPLYEVEPSYDGDDISPSCGSEWTPLENPDQQCGPYFT